MDTRISQLEFIDSEMSECNLIKYFKDVQDVFINFDLDKKKISVKKSVFKISIDIFKKNKKICI